MMRYFPKRYSVRAFFLFFLTFILIISCSFPRINAQEKSKPKPEDWQLNGILAALDDPYPGVKDQAFDKVREYDWQDESSETREKIAKKAAEILKDEKVNSSVRGDAARALANLGDGAKPYVTDILEFLKDESILPTEKFYNELIAMEDEKYKMVVSRQWQDEKGKSKQQWCFRHDKIMDFFLVQTFLGDSEQVQSKLIDHMGDPRFRGVYFLLANLLSPEDALKLREELIQYAADTRDHTVSDTFITLLRTRPQLPEINP